MWRYELVLLRLGYVSVAGSGEGGDEISGNTKVKNILSSRETMYNLLKMPFRLGK
jgi:hypothetical protein